VTESCRDHALNIFSREFLKEICLDTLKGDVKRKERAIKSNSIAFTNHPFLPADAYTDLKNSWMARKAALKKNIHGTLYERRCNAAQSIIEIRDDFSRYKREQNCMMIEDCAHQKFRFSESEKLFAENRSMEKEDCQMMFFLLDENMKQEAFELKEARIIVALGLVNRVICKSVRIVDNYEQRVETLHKATAQLFVDTILSHHGGMVDSEEHNSRVLCKATAQVFVKKALSLAFFSTVEKKNCCCARTNQGQIHCVSRDYVFDFLLQGVWSMAKKTVDRKLRRDAIYNKVALRQTEMFPSITKDHSVKHAIAKGFVRNFFSDAIHAVEKEDLHDRWYGSKVTHTKDDLMKQLKTLHHARVVYFWRELEWMEREQEAQMCEWELLKHENASRSIVSKICLLGKEELKAVMIHKKNKRQLIMCQHLASDAARMEEICHQNKSQKHEDLEDAESKLQWMDTYALTKFHQRWATPKLYKRLYQVYFQKLSIFIAFSAEIAAVQKCLDRLNQELTANRTGIEQKTSQVEALERKFRRQGLLRLRRSSLGRKLFAKERRRTLVYAFRGWISFTRWHQGHRRSYELRFASFHHGALSKPGRLGDFKENVAQNNDFNTRGTVLEQYMARHIQCRRCGKHYTEGHNHERACQYHPIGQQICCSKMDNCSKGSKYGFHIPPLTGHEEYSQQLKCAEMNGKNKIRDLGNEISKIKTLNSTDVLACRKYLMKVSNNLTVERNISKKFQRIKFV